MRHIQGELTSHTVFTCSFGHRGLRLLLTDVIMPSMNGKELFELLITTKPVLKGLYMAGYTSVVIVREGFLEEHVNFVSKPATVKELAAKIREALLC